MAIAINTEQLKLRCTQSIFEIFKEQGVLVNNNYEGHDYTYCFVDNNASVLCVAHCDCVINDNSFSIDGGTIKNPRLDDRLGVYTVLDLLPSLGIKMDILLTDGEESYRSSAEYFTTKKKYNWIVEFDRRGNDCVVYWFNEPKWMSSLREFFTIGDGTFSDISEMTDLGCCAVNIGVGYFNEHRDTCYMSIPIYLKQIACFIDFYNKYKDILFTYNYYSQGEILDIPNNLLGGCKNCIKPLSYCQRCEYLNGLFNNECEMCGHFISDHMIMEGQYYCSYCKRVYTI